MASILMPAFQKYPEEAVILGRLLAGYGDLEFELAQCLAVVVGSDAAFRAMFRLRSESQRLDVADALMRPKYGALKLEAEYADAFAVVDRCRQIRNQYAHCHWSYHVGPLQFTNIEPVVKKKTAEVAFYFTPVDLPLLQEQEQYFEHAMRWLWFLYAEGSARLRGRRGGHPHPKPKRIPPARLDSSQPRQPRRDHE